MPICLLTFKKSFWSFLKRKYQFLWGGIRKSLFAAGGPKINVRVIPTGSVETDFESEFVSAGINQTRHRIYLEVKTTVGIVVPFTDKKTEITTRIPVAETVIIGDVPEFYIDRDGGK